MDPSLSFKDFLREKLQDQHQSRHLLAKELAIYKQKQDQLYKEIAQVRRREGELKRKCDLLTLKNNQLEQQIADLSQPKKSRATDSNLKIVAKSIDSKGIIKQFINESFPIFKDTVKRVFKFFLYMEQHDKLDPKSRMDAYLAFIANCLQKCLLFIFPKEGQEQKLKPLAEAIVGQWRKNKKDDLLQEVSQLTIRVKKDEARIVSYQGKISILQANVKALEGRIAVLEEATKGIDQIKRIKGYQLAHKLKAIILGEPLEEIQKGEVAKIISIFTKELSPKERIDKREEAEKVEVNKVGSKQTERPKTSKSIKKQ